MFKDPAEIEALRESTLALIESNEWEIAFQRQSWTRTSSGGQTRGIPAEIPEQTMYLGAVTLDANYTVFWEGNKVQADYVIVGYWPGHPNELDIKEKDEFTVENRKFTVVEIHPDHQYETRAWVVDTSSGGSGQ